MIMAETRWEETFLGERQDGEATFFVLYADGLLHVCQQEMVAFRGTWIAHWPDQCAAVIAMHQDEHSPLPGTFCEIFRIFASGGVCGSVINCQEVNSDTLDALAAQLVSANSVAIQDYLGSFEPWRISCTHRDVASHRFDANGNLLSCRKVVQSQEIERAIGVAMHNYLTSPNLAPVSLTQYVKELCVWVSHDMFALGFSPARRSTRSMCIDKGPDVRSRADDATAVCMAWLGLAHALALPGPILSRWHEDKKTTHTTHPTPSNDQPFSPACFPHSGSDAAGGATSSLHVLDPMCGVGTCLFAAAFVAQQLGLAAQIRGCDVSEQSILMARHNATLANLHLNASAAPSTAPSFEFDACDCGGEGVWADELDGWAHLVLVDPPWGQRHSSHSQVQRAMPKWAKRWAASLSPAGVLVLVTIRTKTFEHETLPLLVACGLSLLETQRFNNRGYYMCKYYVLVKNKAPTFSLQEYEKKKAVKREGDKAVRASIRSRPPLAPGEAVHVAVAVLSRQAKAVKDELKKAGWLVGNFGAAGVLRSTIAAGAAGAADAADAAEGAGCNKEGERCNKEGERCNKEAVTCLFPVRPHVSAEALQAFIDSKLPTSGARVETLAQPLIVPPLAVSRSALGGNTTENEEKATSKRNRRRNARVSKNNGKNPLIVQSCQEVCGDDS